MRRRSLLLLALLPLFYTGLGFLPGRVFAPLDIPRDAGAWKGVRDIRVRVSNSLLSDVAVQFDVWDGEVRRLVRNGELPWVNVFAGDGAPLFANPQVGLFSPFTWPRIILGVHGWALSAFLKLLVGLLGMWWLARVLGASPGEAAVSAGVFVGSGAFITLLLFPHTNVLTWIPGLAAASIVLYERRTRRSALLVVLLAALATGGGHPETLFAGVLGIGVFLLWHAVAERRTARLWPVAIAAVLGFALLAVQTLPFLGVLRESYARYARPLMSTGGFSWPSVPALVLPGYLGSPVRGDIDLTGLLPVPYNFNHRSFGFIGFLALIAIALSFGRLNVRLRRGIIIGITLFLLSLQLPGVGGLLQRIPVFSLLAPQYLAYPFVLFMSAAAGPAVFALVRRRRLAAVFGVVAVLIVLASVVVALPQSEPVLSQIAREGIEQLRNRGFLQHPPDVYEERLLAYLAAIRLTALHRFMLPALCWVIGAYALRRQQVRVFAVALLAELLVFGVGFNPAIKVAEIPSVPGVVRDLRRLDLSREFLVGAHFETFPANIGTKYGLRDVVSYDVLESRERVTALARAGYDPFLHTLPDLPSAEQMRSLEELGVRYFFSHAEIAGAVRVGGAPPPAVGLYEFSRAQPRSVPLNTRPRGVGIGAIISLVSLALGVTFVARRVPVSPV